MLNAAMRLVFRYLAFARPSAVFTRIRSPSRSTQTGLTCGEWSDITKARLPKFLPSINLIALSESLARGMNNRTWVSGPSVIKEMLRARSLRRLQFSKRIQANLACEVMAGPVGFEPTILGSEGPRLGPGSTTGPRSWTSQCGPYYSLGKREIA